MSKLDIKVYRFDDWEALYIDGERVAEGHSLTIPEFVEHLPLEENGMYFYSDFIDERDYPELEEHFLNGDIDSILKEIQGS
jgi:hypothetical protein